jgi:hypothetical protein
MRRPLFLSLPLALAAAASPALADPPAAPPPAALAPAAPQPFAYPQPRLSQKGTERRSTAMMVTGISLVGVGAVMMIAGTAFYEAAKACPRFGIVQSDARVGGGKVVERPECGDPAGQLTSMAVLFTGSITAALGIPLWILGSSNAPPPLPGPRSGKVQAPKPSAELRLGPGGAGVRLIF